MKHWVFDLDGTLVDSSPLYEKSIKQILNDNGLECGPEDIARSYRHFDPHDFFGHYFDTLATKLAVKTLIEMNMSLAHEIPVFEGMIETLEELRQKKARFSIWTGRDRQSAMKVIEHTGLDRFMDRCVGRTCVAKNKPSPDGLIKILEETRHTADEVIMVGDHAYDIAAARAVGVKAVSVDWVQGRIHTVEGLADFHFSEIPEFREWALALYPTG